MVVVLFIFYKIFIYKNNLIKKKLKNYVNKIF